MTSRGSKIKPTAPLFGDTFFNMLGHIISDATVVCFLFGSFKVRNPQQATQPAGKKVPGFVHNESSTHQCSSAAPLDVIYKLFQAVRLWSL